MANKVSSGIVWRRIRKPTKTELKRIENLAASVKNGDLYRTLHNVGDDDAKVCIEHALLTLLDEDTFCKVVAVFKYATSD